MPAQHAIALLDETWTAIHGVCATLAPADWQRPTDCPGWNVRDQLAHIVGTERTLDGDPLPGDPLYTDHVKNDVGAFNEAWVDHYRATPGAAMLQEFDRVTQRRVATLRALTADQLAREIVTPVGMLPLGDFLDVRAVDSLIHEQDIRRATQRPGHLDTDAARLAVAGALRAMPKAVARRAAVPDGTSVAFVIDGPAGTSAAVGVSGGRGTLLEAVPPHPTCTLDLDAETFLLLGWGRLSADEALRRAVVGIEGDVALGRSVLGAMTFQL